MSGDWAIFFVLLSGDKTFVWFFLSRCIVSGALFSAPIPTHGARPRFLSQPLPPREAVTPDRADFTEESHLQRDSASVKFEHSRENPAPMKREGEQRKESFLRLVPWGVVKDDATGGNKKGRRGGNLIQGEEITTVQCCFFLKKDRYKSTLPWSFFSGRRRHLMCELPCMRERRRTLERGPGRNEVGEWKG